MKKERIKNGRTTQMTATTTTPMSSSSSTSSSSPSPPPGSGNKLTSGGNGADDNPSGNIPDPGPSTNRHHTDKVRRSDEKHCMYECVALHVSPDLGERVMLSGGRGLLDEVFPETTQAVIDARSGVSWHQQDTRHVIRFPLNGYVKLNSVQAITRLLNAGFRVIASNGGGVEGQQFSEYLFVRQSIANT